MPKRKYLYLFTFSIILIFISGLINLGFFKFAIIFLVIYIVVKSPALSVCYFLSFYYIHPGGLDIPFPFQLILILGVLSLIFKSFYCISHVKYFIFDKELIFVLINFMVLSFYSSSSFIWSHYDSDFLNTLPLLLNIFLSVILLFFLLNSIEDISFFKFILIFWVVISSLTVVNGYMHSVLFPDSYIRSAIAIPDYSAVDKFEGVFRWLPPQRDPNYIATTLIMPTVLLFVLLLHSGRKHVLFFLLFVLSVLSIIMSFSRTSYVVISLFILFYTLIQGRFLSPKFLVSIAISLIGLSQVDVFVERLDSLVANALSGSGSGRSTFFTQAIGLWSDNIFLGVGYWQFHNYFYYSVHNTFLEVLVGLGLVGMFLFISPVLLLFFYFFKAQRKAVNCKYVDGVFYGFIFYCLNLNSVSLINLFEYISFLLIGLFFLKASYKSKVGSSI